jgi:hypothetical protein
MQILTNVNSVYLGLTLLAWANSIGGINLLTKIIFPLQCSLKKEKHQLLYPVYFQDNFSIF